MYMCRAHQCRSLVLPPCSQCGGLPSYLTEVGPLVCVGVWLAGCRSGFCSGLAILELVSQCHTGQSALGGLCSLLGDFMDREMEPPKALFFDQTQG